MSTRALLFCRDATRSELIGHVLAQNGFAVRRGGDERVARSILETESFDAVIAHALGRGAHLAPLFSLARQHPTTATVVLASDSTRLDETLELLVDERISVSALPNDVLALVRLAVVRRALQLARHQCVVGPLVLALNERRARYHDRELELTPVQYDLLAALARSVGTPVSRETLRAVVSGSRAHRGERSLDVQICRLRAQLRVGGARSTPVRTVPGIGYVLVGSDPVRADPVRADTVEPD